MKNDPHQSVSSRLHVPKNAQGEERETPLSPPKGRPPHPLSTAPYMSHHDRRRGRLSLSLPHAPPYACRGCPSAVSSLLFLHFPCMRCPLRAVVRVNSAPQFGHVALDAWPDFSRWCRSRLLKVENCLPLQPCSQH